MSSRPRRPRLLPLWCATGLAVTIFTPLAPAAADAASSGAHRSVQQTQANALSPGALHVATTGNDRASGSEKAPLKSITAAVDRADDGDTIVVHAGTYHESIEIQGATGITLMSAPGAKVWLDGSRPVPTWTPSGSAWVSMDWTPEFDSSPTYTFGEADNDSPSWQFVNPAFPMAAHPDQLWIDDSPQAQVGSLAEVRPGTFFVDEPGDQLFVGSDPAGHDVRASAIAKALSVRAEGTRIRGIGVRRFANSVPHMGAVTIEAPRVQLTDIAIEENATTGLHVMESRVRLLRVSLVDNGMMGMTANGADGLRLTRLRVTGNNRERFNSSPAAGGVKVGRGSDVVVRDSLFDRNLGTGLWFDESVYDVAVINSRLTNNASHGMSAELSGKVLVVGSVMADNARSGLKINDTNDAAVWNSTFAGNDRQIDIVQDSRDLDSEGSYLDHSLPLTFRNGPVALRNNVITGGDSDCLLCVEDYSGRMTAEQMGVSARGNLYQRPSADRPSVLVRWSRGDDATWFTSLRSFRKSTGQERRGHSLTGGRVLADGYRVTPKVAKLAAKTAIRIPATIAAMLGVPYRTRALGAG